MYFPKTRLGTGRFSATAAEKKRLFCVARNKTQRMGMINPAFILIRTNRSSAIDATGMRRSKNNK
jgi:hypothetical protein